MTGKEIRQKYIEFFKTKEHVEIKGAPLVPENDPTVLFNIAGMQPLVPYFTGKSHPGGTRLVDYQRCVRTVDLDNVGDATHLSFFEMLGNWSLGDYFKKISIKYSYEFLTSKDWLNLDPSRLAVTVFEGDEDAPRDEESASYWINEGIKKERIAYLPKEDNWWGPAGQTGPCGPDTEIFYWKPETTPPEAFDPKDDNWVEIWNNVFMEYNKLENESFIPLEKKNVDTGMGFERITMALQNKTSVYETDIFKSIMDKIDELTTIDNIKSKRIIADHLRTSTVLVMDEVLPSNVDQGYVLRRLIRRSVNHLNKLEIENNLAKDIIEEIVKSLSYAYPKLEEEKDKIISIIIDEIEKFNKTLKKGKKLCAKKIEELKEQGKTELDGETVFHLYDTYGYPLEVTKEMAEEEGFTIDEKEYNLLFEEHREKSKAGAEQKFKGGLADRSEETAKLHTATHLLHKALKIVLGDHVHQKGSNITEERLRFDFSHPEKVTDEQLDEVEKIVNDIIKQDVPVTYEEMKKEEAVASGAECLFIEKYGDIVSVYTIGDFSKEICGGPHASTTGALKSFKIKKEQSVASGIRRIKATIGK